jgi:seryl-tRNA synthetase
MAEISENINLYEEQIKTGITDPLPYDRLMIYYRKQKEYRKELQLINRALKVFGDQLKRQGSQLFSATKSRATIKKLSDKFSKLSGLMDKKGNPKFIPEPLARWMKRKKTVEQKIKKIKS